MATEQRRPIVTMIPPPCERSFMVFYRDGEPFALEIDGAYFSVKPRRRSPGINDGDAVLTVVEKRLRTV